MYFNVVDSFYNVSIAYVSLSRVIIAGLKYMC